MMTTPSSDPRFEDRLLAELREVVAERPAPAAGLPTSDAARGAHGGPRRRYRRGALAGTGAATAAACGALILAQGGSPAFAVEASGDGTVTVQINSVRDASGLQAKLIAAGIPAVVDYVPDGKACEQPRFASTGGGFTASGSMFSPKGADPGAGATAASHAGGVDGPTTFTFRRSDFAHGETLVLTNTIGADAQAMSQQIGAGTVKPCVLVDAPKLAIPVPSSGAPQGTTSGSGGSNAGPSTDAVPALPALDEHGTQQGDAPSLTTRTLPGSPQTTTP